MNVGYFRRWYGNARVTDNVAVAPEDHSPYCVTSPVDARLPNGGGSQVCGLYNVSPAKFGSVSNVIKLAQGVRRHNGDVRQRRRERERRLPGASSCRAAPAPGARWSKCYIMDSPQALLNCRTAPPFQTQIKLLVVYPSLAVCRRAPRSGCARSADHGVAHLHERRGADLARPRPAASRGWRRWPCR